MQKCHLSLSCDSSSVMALLVEPLMPADRTLLSPVSLAVSSKRQRKPFFLRGTTRSVVLSQTS